ncbi:KEOPS complex subunit Cgi121 [Thermococcus sp.]|uniref:KEOPS complex subunit Cgi121 n=1 Tax=Thermococcus sp. TaxID=35749 RepID=UPI002637A147|nr:KEOPS complex subunit Cgi121 [Thermococcus sp.]
MGIEMEKVGENVYISLVEVEDVEKVIPSLGADVQLVRAQCYEQVTFATILAVRSFNRGTNHARTLGGELLLRLAGILQINEAIRKYGAANGENYLVVFGNSGEASEVMERFHLREKPLSRCGWDVLKNLLEKAALVEVL